VVRPPWRRPTDEDGGCRRTENTVSRGGSRLPADDDKVGSRPGGGAEPAKIGEEGQPGATLESEEDRKTFVFRTGNEMEGAEKNSSRLRREDTVRLAGRLTSGASWEGKRVF